MSHERRARRRGVVRTFGPPILTLAVLGLALFGLGASRADAYVRYKTKATGLGFYWPQTCVPVSVYPASMQDANGNMEMTTDEIVHAVTAAAAAWSAGANACTYLEVNVTASTAATPKAGLDYTNAVVFRTTSWCAPTDGPLECSYAAEALAITSVFVNKQSGKIIDADIEVNARGFSWADLDIDPAKDKQDLQNALTHEMGHLIGLDHTCFVAGTPGGVPLDNLGNPIPDCATASADVQATTMFASAIPGDIQKRTLAPDDIMAVCDIYPVANDPMICPVKDERPATSGCSVTGSPRGGDAGVGLAAFGAIVLAARRRRRRAPGT